MSKVNAFSSSGVRKSGKVTLPKLFDEKPNIELLTQAIRVYEDRLHMGLSRTKRRGEINASKAKMWRQKGTGRARHGARSAPIFVGGGKAHGPTGVTRKLFLPQKMKQKALSVALSVKAAKDEVVVVDAVNKLRKTKDAQKLLGKLLDKKQKRATVILSEENKLTSRVFRNMDNVRVALFRNLNAYRAFYGGTLIFDGDIFAKKTSKTKPKTTKEGEVNKK